MRTPSPVWDRFWSKVEVTKNCWNWTASGSKGYGKFRVGSSKVRSHRFAYELLRGKINEGFELDHLCRNLRCVNPWHLEIVTHRENVLRGVGPLSINAKKTQCIRGHEFTFENTIQRLGGRECRQCKRLFNRIYKSKRRLLLWDYGSVEMAGDLLGTIIGHLHLIN